MSNPMHEGVLTMHTEDRKVSDQALKAAASASKRRKADLRWRVEQAEAKWRLEQAESQRQFEQTRTLSEGSRTREVDRGKVGVQQRHRPKKDADFDPSKSSGPHTKPSAFVNYHSAPVVFKAVESLRGLSDEGASKVNTKTIIHVGTGDSSKTFHIESVVLRECSARFRSHSEQLSTPSKQANAITFPDGDPTVFEMFIEWAKRPKQRIFYAPGLYSDEPWISNAAAAWILRHDLDAIMFTRYALSQFIQNCALLSPETWRYVEDTAPDQSSLLRFSNHWVAWNSHLYGPGMNEYSGLKAVRLAGQANGSTRDPRIFDLEHWDLDCSNSINAECNHNPIFQENQREKERRKSRPPPAEWGLERERASNKNY